jgi:hypothetical protein
MKAVPDFPNIRDLAGHALDTRGRKTMENADNRNGRKVIPEQVGRAQQQRLRNDENTLVADS